MFIINAISNFIAEIWAKGTWFVIKFVLGIMEILVFAASSFLGVGTTVDDYYKFEELMIINILRYL